MYIGKNPILNPAFKEIGLDNVILWDVLDIQHEQMIKITFLEGNSDVEQGVWLHTDRGISLPELGDEKHKSILIWKDSTPQTVICKCFTQDGKLSLYNIFEDEDGRQSQLDTSGMLKEEKDGVYIYRCKNYEFNDRFEDLTFSLEKL
ncbi:hypothetical protein CN918_29640 [Priestia megaterium]|nr:hypothetical protein CN918_29640 [Priestia megaterium]